ncbi:hypothetical protein [Mesorhizobium sp. SARCC-RB16n]|nr:hypothetical protein [Mesorhizobium sp. SARCC-RB16n]
MRTTDFIERSIGMVEQERDDCDALSIYADSWQQSGNGNPNHFRL